MNGFEWLALGLELWTAVGLVGLTISLARRERKKLVQGVGSLVGVWVVYLGVLLLVSYRKPQVRVAMGQSACIHSLCFTVDRVEEVPGFPARNHARLVRVTVRVANRGKDAVQEGLRAYLRDGQGRVWLPSLGVSGNPVDGRVLAGTSVVSDLVFQPASDAAGLELVLTHGRWSRERLVIGGPESLAGRGRVWLLGSVAHF